MSAPAISLAAAIDREHQAAHQAARTAIEHALECGRLLIQAKSEVGHGGWLAWLEVNTSVSARQSQRYMRLATAAIEGKCDATSYLTIESALEAITDQRPALPGPAAVSNHFEEALAILARMRRIADAAETGDRAALREVIAAAGRLTVLCTEVCNGTLLGESDDDGLLVEITMAGDYAWITALVGSEMAGLRRPVRLDAADKVLSAIGVDPAALSWRFVAGDPPIGLRVLFEAQS